MKQILKIVYNVHTKFECLSSTPIFF